MERLSSQKTQEFSAAHKKAPLHESEAGHLGPFGSSPRTNGPDHLASTVSVPVVACDFGLCIAAV